MSEVKSAKKDGKKDDPSTQDDVMPMSAKQENENRKSSLFTSPTCLLSTNQVTGKMEIQQPVLDDILNIEQQLNVVSITGLYRTGKSYLLTRLADRYTGFPLRSTVQSKTKGIWAWCLSHPVHSDQMLLLLDSEGLGDVEKGDTNNDNKLFSLVTLLASTLIYNMIGVFNQEAMDKLTFITEISKHIKTKKSDSDDTDLDRVFPEFILALRDHTLEMIIDGKSVTADEYLEHCLCLAEASDKSTEIKNKPRLCIRKYFKKRHCFTFERPGNAKTLRVLDKLEDKDLDEMFVEDTKKFIDYVWNECKPMSTPTGSPVTGSIFGFLLQSYVKAINDGRIPCIESTLITMAQSENQKAVKQAINKYRDQAKGIDLPVSNNKILLEHHIIFAKAAMEYFSQKAIIVDESDKYFDEANKKLEQEFQELVRRNDDASIFRCTELLTKLHEPIKTKICTREYLVSGGYQTYELDIDMLRKKYYISKETLGSQKDHALREFMEKTMKEGLAILKMDKMKTAAEKEKEIARIRQEAEKEKCKAIKEQNEKMEQEKQVLEQQKINSEKKFDEKMEEMMQAIAGKNEEIIELREAEIERLEDENRKVSAETESLRQENEQLKKENEKCCIQ